MSETKNILMVRGEKTVLTRANVSSYSLRTTVPKGIAKQFELEEKDSLFWEIRPNPEDKKGLLIVVTPEKANKEKRNSKNKKG